ncbi:spore coat protein [Clostridium fermenticellae]|uniref:Spore coat protein n=1 Tax=Clostridium fermenticellae TaxID=2068654 RepID=A0A386H318_9CLOT|nr:spore coat protein [Clostridium fermenticellae]AYD40111.1 spore coat protein [Clostridium fermenticellae]
MNINLSEKERMLLEDQKNHEEICIEKYSNYANQASDPQLKQIFNQNGQEEKNHLNTINQLLSGTIPQMNQQQGQQQNQQQNQQQQNQNLSSSTNQASGCNCEKDMCTDLLMTEKYVSGAYDTSIFEFKDPQARNVLNHIQKEEQQHGEKIFNYMQNNGMYNVK